jgi:hypothetical protein
LFLLIVFMKFLYDRCRNIPHWHFHKLISPTTHTRRHPQSLGVFRAKLATRAIFSEHSHEKPNVLVSAESLSTKLRLQSKLGVMISRLNTWEWPTSTAEHLSIYIPMITWHTFMEKPDDNTQDLKCNFHTLFLWNNDSYFFLITFCKLFDHFKINAPIISRQTHA